MGTHVIDRYSIGHFIWGFLSRFAIPLSDIQSFIVANLIHLVTERQEVLRLPDGTVKQAFGNQLSDVLIFAVGWAVAEYYTRTERLRNTNVTFIASSLILWSTMWYEWHKENYIRRKHCI